MGHRQKYAPSALRRPPSVGWAPDARRKVLRFDRPDPCVPVPTLSRVDEPGATVGFIRDIRYFQTVCLSGTVHILPVHKCATRRLRFEAARLMNRIWSGTAPEPPGARGCVENTEKTRENAEKTRESGRNNVIWTSHQSTSAKISSNPCP
jgi:hypothetical protein